jgi:hypothetical protein
MAFGKRVDELGGQRRSLRDVVMRRVAMMTTLLSRSVDLIDLSTTGAKLRGRDLPPEGQEVLIRLGDFEAFGVIIWQGDHHCGLRFDVALTENALDLIRRGRGQPTLHDLSPEDLMAADDWANDFVR